MRFSSSVLAGAGLLASVEAAYRGFNYGAFFGNDAAKVYDDFKYEFEAAKGLPGTDGQFTSARLYTMIQHGTTDTVITAIQAAIDTQTSLLLGLWASGTTPAEAQTTVNNEISALQAAVAQYGSQFTDLVIGIVVGSEDLYRITPTALGNGEQNPGAQPDELVNYIGQVRSAIAGSGLLGTPVGHVDTWTAFVNGSNSAVIDAVDFIGLDAYPYWESQHANAIENAKNLFYDAYNQVKDVANNKPIWVTETGWAVSGPSQGAAEASTDNSQSYWDQVACQLIRDDVNLFYYTLQDVQFSTPSPSFGIMPGGDLGSVNPLFDLTCPNSAKFSSVFPATTLSSSRMRLPTTFLTDTIASLTPTTLISSPTPMPAFLSTVPSLLKQPLLSLVNSLTSPFIVPRLIISIDPSDPTKIVGNSFTTQLSSTRSTLFTYDITFPSRKTCNVVFALPPPVNSMYMTPYNMTSPGGVTVSRLERAVAPNDPSIAVKSVMVGNIGRVLPGNKYAIESVPCGHGQTVEYRMDATGGLDLTFFQMTSPALGLFIEVV